MWCSRASLCYLVWAKVRKRVHLGTSQVRKGVASGPGQDKAELPGKLNTAKHSETSKSKYHVTMWKRVPSVLLGWFCSEHTLTAWTQTYSNTAPRVPRKVEPNISKLQNPWHPQSGIHSISILRICCAGFSFKNSPNNKKADTTVPLRRYLTQCWRPLHQAPFDGRSCRMPVSPSQLSYMCRNLIRITQGWMSSSSFSSNTCCLSFMASETLSNSSNLQKFSNELNPVR